VKVAAVNHPPNMEFWERLPALEHPNVLRTRAVEVDNGLYCEVQDFYEQGSLQDRLSESGALPAEWIMTRLIPQVNEGLKYLHSQGVVHRDVKPANLFLGPAGEIVLGDFDISTTLSTNQTSRSTNRADGTDAYMAPETFPQYREAGGARATVTRAADYYSLGVAALELAMGTTSLHQCDLPELFDFYLSGHQVALPDEPARLVVILQGLLINDRHSRWTGDQIDRWIHDANTAEDMRRIAEGRRQFAIGQEASVAPYKIGPLVATGTRQLGQILVSALQVPKLAKDAQDDLLGSDRLVHWLTQVDSNVARVVDKDREKSRRNPELALFRCAMLCAPDLPFDVAGVGQIATASDWLARIVDTTLGEAKLTEGAASSGELLKFGSWIELCSRPDADLAKQVSQISKSPDAVRLEEMVFLFDQTAPFPIDRTAYESAKLPKANRTGVADPLALVRTCLGTHADWQSGPPETFLQAMARWQKGAVHAWMRQRGLERMAVEGAEKPDKEAGGEGRAFEAFLRALDPKYPICTLSLANPAASTSIAIYGTVQTFNVPYECSGPGYPFGAIELAPQPVGLRLVENVLAGRAGTIGIEMDAKQVLVGKQDLLAHIVLKRGNFEFQDGSLAFAYRSALPTFETRKRIAVGALAGASIFGGLRLLIMQISPTPPDVEQFKPPLLWEHVKAGHFEEAKWFAGGALLLLAYFGVARLWLYVMPKTQI
jgi:serine/threonine protein kinase